MARDFDGVNDNISFGDIPVISDSTTLSFSIWVWNDAITADMNVADNRASGVTGGYRNYFDDVGSVSGRTDVYNIVIQETAGAGGSSVRIETATSSAVANAWQHVFWSAIAADATGLQIWIDGVEDANSPVSLSAIGDLGNSNGPIKFGETDDGVADRDGRLAECGIWNRVLTDSEIVALSKGYSPLFMPASLLFYSPLIGRNSPELDIKGGASGTLAGTANIAHPRIIYPSFAQIRRFTTAAAGGGKTDWPKFQRSGFWNWEF